MAVGGALTVVRGNEGVSLRYSRDHLVGFSSPEDFLGTLGMEPSNAIVMTSDGAHLTPDMLKQFLASLPSHSPDIAGSRILEDDDELLGRKDVLFAFDRAFIAAPAEESYANLEVHLDQVLDAVEPLAPPESSDADILAALVDSYHRTSQVNHQTSLNLLSHIRCLKLSMTVALRNLDRSVEAQKGALDTFATFAQGSVADYGALLDAYEPSLALARRIRLHPALLSSTAAGSSSVSNSNRTKHMSDHIFEQRMAQVHEGCVKVYAVLRSKFDSVQADADRVTAGIEHIHADLHGTDDLEDLVDLEHDVRDGFDRVEEIVATLGHSVSADERDSYLQELNVLAEDEAERIRFLVERKNYWIYHVLTSLGEISSMQAMLPNISSNVATLEEHLRERTSSFKHLVRLRELVIAYAATIVEIVRRREFARHLLDHSATIGGVFTRLSDDEGRLRKTYRTDHGGKLPFEVRGIDDSAVPLVELELRTPPPVPRPAKPASTVEDMPALTRTDINDLLSNLREIEDDPATDPTIDAFRAKAPAQEIRLFVEAKVEKLDAMETAFALAAERTTMTASQLLAQSVTSRDGGADRAEADQLRIANETLQAEVATLKTQLESETASHAQLRAATSTDGEAVRGLQAQLDEALAAVERERAHADERQRALQERVDAQTKEAVSATSRADRLDEELRTKARALGDLDRHLTSARAMADETTRELKELQDRHATHLSDRSTLEWSLERARERIDQFNAEVAGLVAEKQRLSDRATEKERQLRDHISEAECDRAVLENEVSTLKSAVTRLEEELSAANAAHEAVRSSVDARESEHRQAIDKATADLQAQLRQLELDSSASVAALTGKSRSALKAALQLKTANDRVVARLAAMPAPGSSSRVEAPLPAILEDPEVPSPTTPAFDSLLTSLSAVDVDSYGSSVQKKADSLSQLVRKWMKESKGYRERARLASEAARLKITFRDFGVGDLALFLPTRASTAQIWAAFNVSFPHYFLQPSERVVELTKSREWLVARITSLKSFTVESKDPVANPYALPVGTRYYLLEVDGPYVPDPKGTRKESPPKEVNGSPRKTESRAGSDFSVVEPIPIASTSAASPPAPFSPGDSPFLSSSQSRRVEPRPSGISRSLARSQAGSEVSDVQPSDRPAFLPSASFVSTRTKAPSVQLPRRPVPRARISRPVSRASSASSVRPSIAALLSSSPSNKGASVAVENLSGSLLWKSRTPSGASDLLRRFSETK